MGKSTPDDQTVRHQQLDDEESASIDIPQADRLSERQSSASEQKGEPDAQGTQTEITGSDKVQDELDDALAASFPASDPVSIATSHQEEDWGPGAQSRPADPPNKRGKKQQTDSSQRR